MEARSSESHAQVASWHGESKLQSDRPSSWVDDPLLDVSFMAYLRCLTRGECCIQDETSETWSQSLQAVI